MKLFKKNLIAANLSCALVLGIGAIATFKPEPAHAGIPVIDVASLTQSILEVIESISQGLQMIQSYQTQLQQFQNQIRNTMNIDNWLWDDARQIIDDVLAIGDSVRGFKNQFGSIDAYIGKFKDVDYYEQLPCFTSGGCNRQQLAALAEQNKEQQKLSSEVRKEANDALVKSVDEQQDALERDADKLRDLQSNAQTSSGQLEALQHASQLASNQANQLLQIRALLIAQQSALSAENQTKEDEDARQTAASQALRASRYQQSTGRAW